MVRDRTPFKAELVAKLPKLKCFVFTGARNTQLDIEAIEGARHPGGLHGDGRIEGEHHGDRLGPDPRRGQAHGKLHLALVRKGDWRDAGPLPSVLAGERLGLIGFGGIGARVGKVGLAFGMEVVTWSPHMTAEARRSGRRAGGDVSRSSSPRRRW